MLSIYKHPDIGAVEWLHRVMLADYPGRLTVRQVVKQQAETLISAHAAKDAAACIQLRNWLPSCIGLSSDEIMARALAPEEALDAIAREHGYRDWAHAVETEDLELNAGFERAVEATLDGDIERLGQLVRAHPELVAERSAYPHRATLLHYLGANGVETWRQRVPLNAAAVAAALIAWGAERQAKMPVYGGLHTALEMAATSAHIRASGVEEALLFVLRGD